MEGSLEALHLRSDSSRCAGPSQSSSEREEPFHGSPSGSCSPDPSTVGLPEQSRFPSGSALNGIPPSSPSSSLWSSSFSGDAGKMHSARKNGDSAGFSSVWTAFDEEDSHFPPTASGHATENAHSNAPTSLCPGSALSPRNADVADVRFPSPFAAAERLSPSALSPRPRSELGREEVEVEADSWAPKAETQEESGDGRLDEGETSPWVEASSSREAALTGTGAAFSFPSASVSSPRRVLPPPSDSASPISREVSFSAFAESSVPAVGSEPGHADLDGLCTVKKEGDASWLLAAHPGISASVSEQSESQIGERRVEEEAAAPEERTEGNTEETGGRDDVPGEQKHVNEESVSPAQCHALSHPSIASLSPLPPSSVSSSRAASALSLGGASSRAPLLGSGALLTLPVSPVLFPEEKGRREETVPSCVSSSSRLDSASPPDEEDGAEERPESEERKQREQETGEREREEARENRPARGNAGSPVSSALASAFSPPRNREETEEEQDFPIPEDSDTDPAATEKEPEGPATREGESPVPNGQSPSSPILSPHPAPASSDAANLPSPPDNASSSLTGARRRLDMVNDAEARLMLSTLMHPDDQESRRFLQQVQQNSAAVASGMPQSHAPASSGFMASGAFWSGGGWGSARSRDGSDSASPSVSAASPPAGASRFLFRALNFGLPGFRSARQEEKGRGEESEREVADGRARRPSASVSEATTEFERLLEAQQPSGAAQEPEGPTREAPARLSGANAAERKPGETDGEACSRAPPERENGRTGGSDLGQRVEKRDSDAPRSSPGLPASSPVTPRERKAPPNSTLSASPPLPTSSPAPPQTHTSSTSLSSSVSSSGSASALASPSPASGKPRTPYNVFLDRLKHPSCSAVVVSVKRFVEMFPANLPRAEAARRIHPFLSQVQAALLKAEVFAGAKTESERQQVMEGLERFVLQKLHAILFRETAEDREENEALRKKLHCLSWVEFRHLEVPPLPNASALALGAREIERMDKMRCPRDKLVLILNCCRVIIAVLDSASKAAGSSTPPAADDLLPLLIYTLIQAKPNALHSHIQFISFFRHPSRLVSEEAYFFTHFCSAVEFVKMLGQPGVTLNDVTDEEYRRRMTQAEAEYERRREAERETAEKGATKEGHAQKIDPRKTLPPADSVENPRGASQRGRLGAETAQGPVNADTGEKSGGEGSTSLDPGAVVAADSSAEAGAKKDPKEKDGQDFAGAAPAALAAAASALSTLEHLSSSSSPFVRGSYGRTGAKHSELLELCGDIQRQPLSFQEVSSADLKVGQIPALLEEYKELVELLTKAACLLRELGSDTDAKHSGKK
ncbi:ADL349Wp, related [Neospora caninum Liverpool]|uniref:ADL349Wp, related n=1 Tax=Neospora caninum (strain Liverpool) TaxID=572307 RepID=F0VHT2_NEOCL|nr:ADL349Wp, related [Neospora caninum Liverpool]CBZ53293.1 ADL349Wp, related [Neospora caninum Liverpool]CEL67279.1 TPA: ADL349Wp, related [Neospora caninum Liverpool]|eukprot:XP_003883325.1 ADL349Wp, related [Neospora caninum Liverpool]